MNSTERYRQDNSNSTHGELFLEQSSTVQLILERGREKGRVEGRRIALLILIKQKFGSIPHDLETQIESIPDAVTLEIAIRQMLTIRSLEELIL